jgi:hypothetical protein
LILVPTARDEWFYKYRCLTHQYLLNLAPVTKVTMASFGM